jgi:flagellar hook-basal body complex protein FliE
MSEIRAVGAITGLEGSPKQTVASKEKGESFEAMLKDAVRQVNTIQNEAEKAVQDLTVGGDITAAVLAMEKADLTFQIMVEVRNKLISAYEEIMRMQV